MTSRWTGITASLRSLGALSVLTLALTGCGPGGDAEQVTGGAEPMLGTVRAHLGLPFTYNASNTHSATQNTTNGVIALTAGQKITVGTCGVSGASFSGDTFLRLYAPGVSLVSYNDDACGGIGSSLTYTVPSGAGGNYEVRAGCYSTSGCSGTVAATISGGSTPPPPTGPSLTYTASNTSDGYQNTVNQTINLVSGQSIVLGTCGVPGSSSSGDNRLSLYHPNGYQLVASSGRCNNGSAGTYLAYTVPSGGGGGYQLRAGCPLSETCSGTVVWRLSPGGNSLPFSSTPSGRVGQSVQLLAGQTLSVGTCGMSGAFTNGDSDLIITNSTTNWEVARNDNACGGASSHLLYTVPAGAGGTYSFLVGCKYSNCSGTLVWSVW